MNTEVAKTEKSLSRLQAGGSIKPFIPNTLEQIATVAANLMKAGLVPKSYEGKDDATTKSTVMIGLQTALEVGLPPLMGINSIAIINGRPSVWGDGAMALVHNSGRLQWSKEYYEGEEPKGPIHEWPDEYAAVCEMKRIDNDEAVTRRFSVGDAKRAKLWGSRRQPWIEYPKRMLAKRALSWCIRDLFADCLSGLSIAEEAQDIPMRDITPPDTSYLDEPPTALEAPQEEGEVIEGEPVTEETEAPESEVPPAILYLRDNPTKKEVMEWRDAMHQAVADAPDVETLDKLLAMHQSGLAYLKENYESDWQNLQAAIDERLAQLNPLAAV